MTFASFFNYPGGLALAGLHATECNSSQPLAVHIGNMAAISGVSRFLQERSDWQYSKEENLSPHALSAKGFDRLLSEFPEVPGYHCTAIVYGFSAMKLEPRWPGLNMLLSPQVYILARAQDGTTDACNVSTHPKWSAASRPEFQALSPLNPPCRPK